jgi:tetratricopeptide (TPR) repeat protein
MRSIFVAMTMLLFFGGCSAEKNLLFEEYINKANSYIEKGDFDKGVYFYKKAEGINPNDAATHLALGKLYNQIWEKSYEEAYAIYKEELRRGVKSGLDLDEELKKYGLKYQYKDMALSEYQKVVSIEPSSLDARNYLALNYLNNKQYANAIKEYKSLLQYDNKSSLVYWHLANAYLRAGDYNHAIEHIENAYRIEKKVDYYQYRLGEVYFKMKNHGKAFQMLTTLRNEKSIYYDKLIDYKISNGM